MNYKALFSRAIRRIMSITDNLQYGQKGKNVRIRKPMRIIGKSRISLGNNVSILDNGRLETIRVWGGYP